MTGELDNLTAQQIVQSKINYLQVLMDMDKAGSDEYLTAINHLKEVLEALENQPYEGAEEEPFWLIQGASREGYL